MTRREKFKELRRKTWMHIWRFYDSPYGSFLPHRIAPWLLGKALGSKGVKKVAVVRSCRDCGTKFDVPADKADNWSKWYTLCSHCLRWET